MKPGRHSGTLRVAGAGAEGLGFAHVDRHPLPWLAKNATVLTAVALGAASSAFVRVGYDEAYWISIARMVASGSGLYDGAIDNKTPVVYTVFGGLDALPGAFEWWRGMVIAGLLVAASTALRRVTGHRIPEMVTVLFVAMVALVNGLHLTIELLALPALLWAMSAAMHGHWARAALLAIVGAALDPRTVLLIPVVVAWAGNSPTRVKLGSALLAALGVAAVTTLWSADSRFGLIELNLASRGRPWSITEQAAVVALVMLPIVTVVAAYGWRMPRPRERAWIILAAAIAVVSALPFPHYWTYVLVGMAWVVRPTPLRLRPALAAALVLVSMWPAVQFVVTDERESQLLLADYESATAYRQSLNGESGDFVVFDLKPFSAYFDTSGNLLRAPAIPYLIWPTSRTAAYLGQLPALISQADAIVDDGGLAVSVDEYSGGARALRAVYEPLLDDFRCVREIGAVTVRTREACP